ncbi:hypothetical protein [Rickettsiella endosymbiont of Miltochrista miniata]|uniref:hypothetical protein n=1 Tax=Rickettsiella endosymbiont of Miltochrista miniata TaxID=3066239 RepID=UPI00313B6699
MASEANIQTALKMLEENHISSEHKAGIAAHIKPIALAYALCELKKNNLLTSQNSNTLQAHLNPQRISSALNAIGPKLATQENLNILFALKNLEFTEHGGYLFYRIPENKFSQSVFDEIIELSKKTDSISQINHYINQLLSKINPTDDSPKKHSTLFQPLTPSDSGITNNHPQNSFTP